MNNVDSIEYTVYNKGQIIIWNYNDVFGSCSRTFRVEDTKDKSIIMVDLDQVHWKAFDQPGDRCTQDLNPNTSRCIQNYVASRSECQLPSEEGQKEVMCTSYDQYQLRSKLSQQFEKMDENQIFAETGCLPSCDKMAYGMSEPRYSGTFPAIKNNSIFFHFLFEKGRYSVKEQGGNSKGIFFCLSLENHSSFY